MSRPGVAEFTRRDAAEKIDEIRVLVWTALAQHNDPTINGAQFVAGMSRVIGEVLAMFPLDSRDDAFNEWVKAVELDYRRACLTERSSVKEGKPS